MAHDFIWDIEKLSSPLEEVLQSTTLIAETKESLLSLQTHPGWQFLLRMIDYNAKVIQNELNDKDDITVESIKDLQRRRRSLVKLAQLPERLINKLSETSGEDEEDPDDPFD